MPLAWPPAPPARFALPSPLWPCSPASPSPRPPPPPPRALPLPPAPRAALAGAPAPPPPPAGAADCPGADLIPAAGTLPQVADATVCLLNEQRAAHGLAPTRPNVRLAAASAAY